MIELFKIGFMTVTLIDLIDVTVIAILVVWLYRALRDTIAIQILFGLVVLIVLSFITEAINLKAMNWILKTISGIWLLAFIILFQPELRRLMLLITRTGIFKLFVKSKIAETIDEVLEATLEMSEKHIGALIVFPRTQNVEMTIDSGIQLQALVSKDLILSIFNTRAPLHDGAIIIDNELLHAARCVLPLSQKTKWESRNLGTRHRAALGLSEQSDAVILIVSEERGSISLAEDAKLTLDIPRQQLATILKSHLGNTK